MTNNLVIVESPSKAKTINKYLGKDFQVLASFGHIRDLPSKNDSVRPEDNFAMDYEINIKAKKHAQEIVNAAKNVQNIYLASDPDREGEAIAWHVVEVLKEKKAIKKDVTVKRVVFNEITKKAVNEAFSNPRDIDMNLVNAQQARRALDYLVGFTLSPVLWRKLPGSRSAGRVQSVALRLICERDFDIAKFVSREYWSIQGEFLNQAKQNFTARLTALNKKKLDKFDIINQEQAEELKASLEKKEYEVSSVEKKRTQRHSSPPFITSTLQQEAARKLGFSASKTMQVAQKLYEGLDIDGETVGLITYMRTDGVQLSNDAVESIRNYIQSSFGAKYLPPVAKIYKSKVKNAQEAHEAIRPTNILLSPDSIKNILSIDQFKLYDLIWKRTISCQMQSAEFDQTAVDIDSTDKYATFRATGSVMVFDGFYKVYSEGKDDEEEEDEEKKLLPLITENEIVQLTKILTNQHFTEPLPRYTEASLVKKLEELGIGRPSTYASIISVLQDREYVRLEKKRFISEDRGKIVTTFLMLYFKQYVEYDFTAQLEDRLDSVSAGNLDWKELLDHFWKDFYQHISQSKEKANNDISQLVSENLANNLALPNYPKICPTCNEGHLLLKTGKFGLFFSCSRYPSCKHIEPYGSTKNPDSTDDSTPPVNKALGSYLDQEVCLKKGPYGFYFQLGEGKTCKRSALPKFISPDEASLEQAIRLFSFPLVLGKHPDDSETITLAQGRFGPFIAYAQQYYSLPNKEDILTLNLSDALKIISEKTKEPKSDKAKEPKRASITTKKKKK
ncbi:MAG: type I DNA topoisomerase [Rickettsiales bacterium]